MAGILDGSEGRKPLRARSCVLRRAGATLEAARLTDMADVVGIKGKGKCGMRWLKLSRRCHGWPMLLCCSVEYDVLLEVVA